MELKMCPTCKTWVFADMDTCYGCMYRFGTDPEREEAVRREYEDIAFPEQELEARENLSSAAATLAIPWPPPAEPSGSSEATASSAGFAAAELSAGEGKRHTGFEAAIALPEMLLTVKSARPLPAGLSFHIAIEPPRGETARAVQ